MVGKATDQGQIRIASLRLKGTINALATLSKTLGGFEQSTHDINIADDVDKALQSVVVANNMFQDACGLVPARRTAMTSTSRST